MMRRRFAGLSVNTCNIARIYFKLDIVAIVHMGLYTSDIGWVRWVNIVSACPKRVEHSSDHG